MGGNELRGSRGVEATLLRCAIRLGIKEERMALRRPIFAFIPFFYLPVLFLGLHRNGHIFIWDTLFARTACLL